MAVEKKQASKKRRRGTKSTGRPSSRIKVADAAPADPPPEYLVVFKKKLPHAQKVQSLQTVLRATSTRSFSGLSKLSLSKPGATRAAAEVYRNFGVAAASLTDAECAALMARDQEIADVVKNEKRSIPRDPDPPRGLEALGATAGPILPLGGTAGRLLPFGGTAGPRFPFASQGDAMLDYMRGYRDGVNGLVDQFQPPQKPLSLAAFHGADVGYTYGLALLGLARANPIATGQGITVAVLDTGIDTSHPDLAGQFGGGGNFRSFVPSEATIEDFDGHGTHVAGTIVSQLRARPRYGVAPDSDVLIAKVLNKDGEGYDSYILDAIDWAIDNGARVINMSLGSVRGPGDPYSMPYQEIASIYLDETKGPLFVAAAGNESNRQFGRIAPVGNPAACPSVVSVAGVTAAGGISWFSSGQVDDVGRVDIAGPGSDVYSAVPGGAYGSKSGTSMAAPHVSGIAALYLERNPGFTPREVRGMLVRRAKSLQLPTTDVGAGLVQAPRASR